MTTETQKPANQTWTYISIGALLVIVIAALVIYSH
jgi:uncharacterized membrane protein YidH (DUF202 family)